MRLDEGNCRESISRLELRLHVLWLEELKGSDPRKVAFQLLAGLPTWLSHQRWQGWRWRWVERLVEEELRRRKWRKRVRMRRGRRRKSLWSFVRLLLLHLLFSSSPRSYRGKHSGLLVLVRHRRWCLPWCSF
jgi:hypothetical protein